MPTVSPERLIKIYEWKASNPERVRASQSRSDKKRYHQDPISHCAAKQKYRATTKGKARALLNSASHRAKRKGLPFTLAVDDIRARLDRGVCEITGLPFDFSNGRGRASRSPYAPSLDQIEAGKGYTPENTRLVCTAVNAACLSWGLEAFIPFAEAILRRATCQ